MYRNLVKATYLVVMKSSAYPVGLTGEAAPGSILGALAGAFAHLTAAPPLRDNHRVRVTYPGNVAEARNARIHRPEPRGLRRSLWPMAPAPRWSERRGTMWPMRYRTLRWLTVAGPLIFLALVDVLRHQFWPELLHPWPGYLIVLSIVAGGAWIFSGAVFGRIERMERRIVGQNRELRAISETANRQAAQLRALHEAELVLSSDLTLETVLRRIVDLAQELTGARYGALAVVDDGGAIVRFLTSGLTPEERVLLGDPPIGRGLLGPIFHDNRPIRVDEISLDFRSCGFPPGHPPMRTYLGVPITLHGRAYGNVYLTDKQGPSGPVQFTEEDEGGVMLFAAQAAIDSAPGKGTCVIVSMPVESVPAAGGS